jgi:hypothetical protein
LTRRPNEIQLRRTVPSALLAVALLSGADPGSRFDESLQVAGIQSMQVAGIQSMQVAGIRQPLAQRPAPESNRNLQSFLSNATHLTFHPWSSGSTLSIAPEPTLHGRARVSWGGSMRLAIRF